MNYKPNSYLVISITLLLLNFLTDHLPFISNLFGDQILYHQVKASIWIFAPILFAVGFLDKIREYCKSPRNKIFIRVIDTLTVTPIVVTLVLLVLSNLDNHPTGLRRVGDENNFDVIINQGGKIISIAFAILILTQIVRVVELILSFRMARKQDQKYESSTIGP